MENFVVSARKYRPQSFSHVVGQEAITHTLQNAIKNNHLAQALLFCGPRGVGKTTCARILAKEINREDTQHEEEDFAFNIFELDAASNNSVDDIRALIDQVRIPPQIGKYKVYIIDEVHMLSQAAFNAFLKTLEEPPKHAIFILATTEKHKIIPTILSRCQIFDFKRITIKDAKTYLHRIAENQGVDAEDGALHIIAQKADGAMRDALSIFDRVVSFSGKNLSRKAVAENLNVLDYEVYLKSTQLILDQQIPQLLLYLNEIIAQGFEAQHFIIGLAAHFRDLLVCKDEATVALLEVGDDIKPSYLAQAQKTTSDFLIRAIELANNCDLNYKASKNQRLLTELCLMQLASIGVDIKKKNESAHIIAPVSPTKSNIPAPKQNPTVSLNDTTALAIQEAPIEIMPPKNDIKSHSKTEKAVVEKPDPIPQINTSPQQAVKVSGLSISSIKTKKKHEEIQRQNYLQEKELPTKPLVEENMQEAWQAYIKILENKGKKIMASILSSAAPKLADDHIIAIELPNDTMEKELQKDQRPLMTYLHKELQNYNIRLSIKVNETQNEKYAFTPLEKYEKLRQKNPLIDTLRKEFDLEI